MRVNIFCLGLIMGVLIMATPAVNAQPVDSAPEDVLDPENIGKSYGFQEKEDLIDVLQQRLRRYNSLIGADANEELTGLRDEAQQALNRLRTATQMNWDLARRDAVETFNRLDMRINEAYP